MDKGISSCPYCGLATEAPAEHSKLVHGITPEAHEKIKAQAGGKGFDPTPSGLFTKKDNLHGGYL